MIFLCSREISNSGRTAGYPGFRDRVLAAHCIGQKRAGLLLGLFERKQGAMLARVNADTLADPAQRAGSALEPAMQC
jgi:hypothetical protein